MGFWKAIGLGVGLIVIRIMMPEVFNGLEDTVVKFFSTLTDALAFSQNALLHGQTAALAYPQVPPIQ